MEKARQLITKIAQRKGVKARAQEFMLSAGRCTRALAQFIREKSAFSTDALIDAAVDVQITVDQIRAYDPAFFDLLHEQKVEQVISGKYKLGALKK